MSATMTISCPYCGHSWAQVVSPPDLPVRGVVGDQVSPTLTPREVRAVPYVRDVGKFDPDPWEDWDNPSRGSWVGSDFMPALRFDERFGILTAADRRWPQVVYRVERCPGCLHHVDAYYSYSSTTTLAAQFPHLFSQGQEPLHIPDHPPLPAIFVDKMNLTPARGVAATLVAIVTWWGMGVAAMALARTLVSRFEWLEFTVAIISLLVSLLASGLLLHLLLSMLKHLSGSAPFDQVIATPSLKDPSAPNAAFSVLHWVSFTRCRYTGRPSQGRALRTTTELLGGATAVVSLLVVVLLHGDLTLTVVLPRLIDAFWWFPVAYMLGSSLQLAATTVHYVLAGLTRVPLRLDIVHPRGDLPVLRSVQRYVKLTGTTVAVLLVALLATNAALRGFLDGGSPLAWVDLWFLVIVLLGLVSLGLTHEPTYLAFALVAGMVIIPLREASDVALPLTGGLTLDPITVWLGLVFTVLLLVEIQTTNGLVARAMRNTLESMAARLMRDAPNLSTTGVHQARAAVEAARTVVDLRSNLSTSAALAPLVAGVVLPAALDSLLASLPAW